MLLQETHSIVTDERFWPSELGGGRIFFSHGEGNARGEGTFISKNVDFRELEVIRDNEGRALFIILETNGTNICIGNVYCPNLSFDSNDKLNHEMFLESIHNTLNTAAQKYDDLNIILAGDFNMIMHTSLDANGGNPTIYAQSINCMNKIAEDLNITDIFRSLYPQDRLITFSPGGRNVRNIYRRLDYIWIPESWRSKVTEAEITPAFHSDHRIVKISFRKDSKIKGRGSWMHNDLLNDNTTYLEEFHDLFPSWTEEAKVLDDPRSRWEFLKFKIKCHSRDFSVRESKKKYEYRKNLETQLTKLEKDLAEDTSNDDLIINYAKTKSLYDKILTEDTNKLIFQARIKVYEQGEKSTAFFFRQIKNNSAKANTVGSGY